MSDSYKLSEGSLKIIMNGGDVSNPIMQVLQSKKIHAGNTEKGRFRILLSDGKFTISFAMLTTQTDDKQGIGIENNSVIKVKRYITSVINNVGKADTRILLILDMELIANGSEVGHVIGSPTPLTDDNISQSNTLGEKVASNGNLTISLASTSNALSVINSNNHSIISDTQIISPISSLSPYHNKWVIKVRVINKSAIRTWSNSRGEGKLFNFDLIDDSGEIRCTGFRDMVEKYYDYIEVEKVYYISKCQIKPANKQFNTLKNDYEMTMTGETIIEECKDNNTFIPQVKYDFVPIDKIAVMETGTLVDVIGVCKNAGEVQRIVAKTSGRELKKKEVTLVDQTKNAISLTLWGSEAEQFNGNNNPVVVIKGAKIGEFGGGKNLSVLMSSQLKVNPDIAECYRLKGWYDLEGNQSNIVNISARAGLGGMQTPWMTFKEVQEMNLGNNQKGDYYQLMGTVLLIRSENAIYKACPTNDCNKKVIDMENGMYRCEKCNREFTNFKYRLLASVNVGDWTGNQWVSMFSSEAEKLVGKTAQEVGQIIENESSALAKIFEAANFKQFIFRCRAKIETYNDESRLKTVAIKVDPVNYQEYNSYLVDRIQQLIS